jgi:hypothetical protein
MNVNLTPPITVILDSGFLVSEGDGVGTIQFKIQDQPVSLVFPTSAYTWDTVFAIGDRVKVNTSYGAFGQNSEGILNSILIDSTDDKGIVYFDLIVPNNEWNGCHNLKAESGDISVKETIPLRLLTKI